METIPICENHSDSNKTVKLTFSNSVKNILMCLVVLILYNTWPPNMYWLCSSVRIILIFVWGWLQRMWKKLAQDFNFSFRIDDIINIDFLYRIYPKCVWIKCYHRHSIMSASFVDLYLEKDDECRVKSKYYTQLSIPSVGMCNKLYIYIFIVATGQQLISNVWIYERGNQRP